jgi:hypothetical protein
LLSSSGGFSIPFLLEEEKLQQRKQGQLAISIISLIDMQLFCSEHLYRILFDVAKPRYESHVSFRKKLLSMAKAPDSACKSWVDIYSLLLLGVFIQGMYMQNLSFAVAQFAHIAECYFCP